MKLEEFIVTNRETIIARTRTKVAARMAPRATHLEMQHGVPLFLDQLTERLRAGAGPEASPIGPSAEIRGGELQRTGLTIGQVVHDYGDVCHAITELAVELGATIGTADFHTLNLCLDVAIASAVTEYSRQREKALLGEGIEQLGSLAHELRHLVNTATLSFDAVRLGSVGLSGNTGGILARSLAGMSDLVNRTLAAARLEAGPPRHEAVVLAQVLEEIEIGAAMHARARGVELSIDPAEPGLVIDGDAQIVASIVTNLVQNACKFTPKLGRVRVHTRSDADRVSIEVADQCGGLPPGDAEDLFRPYQQRATDRSGLGLGLAISRRGARAIGGDIDVRNVPGVGCVFTVQLVRSRPPLR